jgi:hypothetical protein
MEVYAAIDLHASNSFLAVVDREGKSVFKRRLVNDPAILLKALDPYKKGMQGIAVESTFNCRQRWRATASRCKNSPGWVFIEMNGGMGGRRRPGARGRPSRDKADWFVWEEQRDDGPVHDEVYEVSGQNVILKRCRERAF